MHGFPQSRTRQGLFDNYLVFMEELRQVVPSGFQQWINGSFSTRKTDPNDLDLVTFLDFETYEAKGDEIEKLRQVKFNSKGGIDCYFLQVFPEGHRYRIRTQMDTIEWLDLFSHARPRPGQKKLPKGFVELNF